MFFFGDFQSTGTREAASSSLSDVDAGSFREGDFSG
jgi:hypothetical protein